MKCPICFANVADDAANCGSCGSPMRKSINFCSNCGQNTKPEWSNCKYCGNPLICADSAKKTSSAGDASEPQTPPPGAHKENPRYSHTSAGYTPPEYKRDNAEYGGRRCPRSAFEAGLYRMLDFKNFDPAEDLFIPNSRLTAVILAVVGGSFGAHDFYLGNYRSGFIHIALMMLSFVGGITTAISVIWSLYDAYRLIAGEINFTADGTKLK